MEHEELWSTVIGQPEAVSFLKTASKSPVHAYLFIGPEGAGRRQAAHSDACCEESVRDPWPMGRYAVRA